MPAEQKHSIDPRLTESVMARISQDSGDVDLSLISDNLKRYDRVHQQKFLFTGDKKDYTDLPDSLKLAILSGDSSAVLIAISDTNVQDFRYELLMLAAFYGRVEILRMMFDAQHFEFDSDFLEKAFDEAVKGGAIATVDYLLGLDSFKAERYMQRVATLALKHGHLPLL